MWVEMFRGVQQNINANFSIHTVGTSRRIHQQLLHQWPRSSSKRDSEFCHRQRRILSKPDWYQCPVHWHQSSWPHETWSLHINSSHNRTGQKGLAGENQARIIKVSSPQLHNLLASNQHLWTIWCVQWSKEHNSWMESKNYEAFSSLRKLNPTSLRKRQHWLTPTDPHFSTEEGENKFNLQQLVSGGTTLIVDKEGISAINPTGKLHMVFSKAHMSS